MFDSNFFGHEIIWTNIFYGPLILFGLKFFDRNFFQTQHWARFLWASIFLDLQFLENELFYRMFLTDSWAEWFSDETITKDAYASLKNILNIWYSTILWWTCPEAILNNTECTELNNWVASSTCPWGRSLNTTPTPGHASIH